MAATMLNAVTDIDKPAFIIHLDKPELLEANPAARELWGLASETRLPFAIDAEMPALSVIRAVSSRTEPSGTPNEFHDQLVFWTQRGAQRLTSRYHLSADNARVTVVIDESVGAAPNDADTALESDQPAAPAEPAKIGSTALDLRTMAHELRTPIGAVIALADMIDQEPFGSLGDPRYREYARDIRDSAHLALNIVAAALERNEGNEEILFGGIHEIDLEALLQKARRALRLDARSAGLAIDIETPPDMPLLLANSAGLNQILLNLIANAIKFTPPGGHITLAAKMAPAGGLDIHVTDTGIGMTEYETSVLVEPSKTPEASKRPPATGPIGGTIGDTASKTASAPSLGGAPLPIGAPNASSEPPRHRGIGFTLVRRLAAAMGATLTVSSQRGVGTRVTVSFPTSNVVPQPRSRDDA
jgi:signal transduction histidine kinase